jgi:hypothetical protein
MADKKISALTASATPLAGTEVLPIVQGGSTVKVSVADLTAGRSVSSSSVANGLGTAALPSYTFTGDTNTGMWSPGADLIAFSQGGTERLRIVASGLETSSIAATGNITSTGTGAVGSNLRLIAAAASPNIQFLRTGYENWYMGSPNNSTDLYISAGSAATYRMYFASGGNVTVSAGNLVIGTAGKGIDFSASTHGAGMTSELLNDYEEGTWTPNQGPGLTVVGAFSSSGTYTKIGRAVTVRGSVSGATSISVTSGGIIVSNLPFTVSTTGEGAAGTGNVNQGSVVLAFNVQVYAMTAITPAAGISFTITYFV